MSDSISRRTFLKCAAIGTLVAFPVATYAVRRWRGKSSSILGTVFDVEPLPIPDEVSGPFRTRTCVSSDEKHLLLAGRSPLPKEAANVFLGGGTKDDVKILENSLGQSLYVSSWSPKKKEDYRCIAKFSEPCFIQAMAVHSVTSNVAFFSRESWLNRQYPETIRQKINKANPLLDVLYTLPLGGGTPIPLQAFPDPFTRKGAMAAVVIQADLESVLFPVSLCWHSNGESIYCLMDKKIIRVFLDGKSQEIFDLSNNHVASSFSYNESGLSFVNCRYPDHPDSKTPANEPPSLITLDDNGVIKSQKNLLPFPLGANDCLFNVVFNEKKWAALTPTFSEVGSSQQLEGFKLEVIDLDVLSSGVSRKILSDIQENIMFDLCHFFPGSHEVLAIQYNKFLGMSGKKTQLKFSQDGGVDFNQFLRIKITWS
ncbi:MAG: hypothetical protein LBJ67_09535 [Planctomycetaceae bacterium]|nr:hypothetical protein [Planctomycetaceae bacterium]